MLEGGAFIPDPDRYIAALFGERGYLSRAFTNYRPRPGQIALAEAVDRAIVGRTHLLAEAGTGVGKSLAYAAPASYHASMTGHPVVIVTANIALQEQIVGKDLPLLRKVAPWPFTFALLKGRNNYLCLDKFYGYQADRSSGRRPPTDQAKPEERRQLPVIEQWAGDCARAGLGAETGDVSDLPFEPLPHLWKLFSVSASDCKRSRCRFRRECFAIDAADRARSSLVVVTNYHLLFAHVSAYLETERDIVINPFTVAVLDEGHKAADIARDVFGFRITSEAIRRIDRKIRDDDAELADRLFAASTDFFLWMLELVRNRARYKSRLTGDHNLVEWKAWEELSDALDAACTHFIDKCRYLEGALEQLQADDIDGKAADELNDELGDAEILRDRAQDIRDNLTGAMHPEKHPRGVFFLQEDRGRVAVSSRLKYPKDALTLGLFEKVVAPTDGPKGGPVTVIVTSATLATAGGDFSYVAEELGCPPGYESLVAPSPFDWPSQCLFICPEGMPDPNAEEFKDAVASVVGRVIRLAHGRTLGLFTSRRVLDHTYNAVQRDCTAQGYTLLKQGDAPRTQLLETFKTNISSVLLGTESFWAGVDVPGESLSVVVIDRLPFPTPDDPILDALAATDDNWFQKYSIPRAMIAFKQGFGRLVRSLECRGVVVCLDNRLLNKRYGKQFLRAMPAGVPKSMRLEAIAEWLGLPLPGADELPAPDAPPVPTPAPPPQLALFAAPPRIAPLLPHGWDDLSPQPANTALAWDER